MKQFEKNEKKKKCKNIIVMFCNSIIDEDKLIAKDNK